MFRKILVPLDGSELAEQALPYAEQLTRDLGSELLLLQVVSRAELAGAHAFAEREPAVALAAEIEAERQEAASYLDRVAEQFELAELPVQWLVRSGDSAGEIVECAKDAQADLIVMSTHGRSGLSRWVYGSVADRVLRGSSVPVLLVRSASPAGSADNALLAQAAATQR